MPAATSDTVIILIPVFNDWPALKMFLPMLDQSLGTQPGTIFEVLVVDDGSTTSGDDMLRQLGLKHVQRLRVLELRRNLGHQRAITAGLCHVEEHLDCRTVIVMDGDGEDSPPDVLRLLSKSQEEGHERVVFASRRRRRESLVFRAFYQLYRVLHWSLTGYSVRVGNFSAIPRSQLSRLVVVSELWNHYSAGLMKARVPYVEIPVDRSKRVAGESKMNFVTLVTHGLSAISVHAEVAGVRMLMLALALIVFAVVTIGVVLYVRLATDLAIPGWATYLVVMFLIVIMQTVGLALFFVFTVLGARNNFSFMPLRDYRYFVKESRVVSEAAPV